MSSRPPACAARAGWLVAALLLADAATAGPATRNLVLVTLDGVRVQEFFGGLDPVIARHEAGPETYDDAELRERYWRATPAERRAVLMPFFWTKLAPMGVVLGNPATGSSVTVGNAVRWSSPGYVELMTGEPQPGVRDNAMVRYPHETVLDYLQRRLGLGYTQIAQLGSWDGFKLAASRADNSFFMNGAEERVPAELATPEMNYLTLLRTQVMELWPESSNDALTFRLALAYLKQHRPRVLWLGLGQSDDWAHARRYDRLLDYLHLADGFLDELWRTLQGMDEYRDCTTIVITTDHGRGRLPADWHDHDASIPGSEQIWIAVIGPDTPDRGEVSDQPPATLGSVAATLLALSGLDYRDFNAHAALPVPGSLAPVAAPP